MSASEREAIVRRLTARGVRVLDGDESSPEFVLGTIREQRRRHASNPRFKALGTLGERLAKELREETGVPSADIAKVLLSLASKLGALAVGHDVPTRALLELTNFAADEADRQAKAGGETGETGGQA